MTYQAIHHPMEKKFTVVLEGGYNGEVRYTQEGTTLHLEHAEMPEALRGKGLGGSMVEAVLRAIEQERLKVVPVCPYIKHYMETHRDWAHLKAEQS